MNSVKVGLSSVSKNRKNHLKSDIQEVEYSIDNPFPKVCHRFGLILLLSPFCR